MPDNVRIGPRPACTYWDEAGTGAMDAIEFHSHIDTEEGIALLRLEHINYTLLMWRGEQAMLDLAQRNKDIVGLLLWVVPTRADYLAEARAMVKKHPRLIRGFKLHSAMDHYTVGFELLEGLFRVANDLNLLIQTHTEPLSCNPARFAPLMAAFPATKLILLHGCPAQETFDMINAYENVYVDTSHTAWGRSFQSAALKAVGMEKIVMGLDSPLGFPSEGRILLPHFRQAMVEIAAFYDNDKTVAEHVLYRNARRLLDGLS